MSPKPITLFHLLSILVSSGVLGLSTVNFGVLCIWINSTISFLIIVYHITVLILGRRTNSRIITTPAPIAPKRSHSITDLKLPTYPCPTYSPPPYEKTHLSPNRGKTVSPIQIPNTPPTARGVEVITDDDGAPRSLALVPSGPFYNLPSLLSIVTLTIISIIGFSMTLDLTVRGTKSLLPAERTSNLTPPWNLGIQKAQCVLLGAQIIVSLVVVFLCVRGRSRIRRVVDDMREEIECGMASPRECRAVIRWYEEGV